ncbi:kinase-like protein [Gloeophyllum trabeum ATCC 11539]|uniref:Kinase-like protein n=1 Tax=Gloeophyllum trabeum (strain ATCC 11539 / FP-39264 / Madison 617) TaxID=670483 RepID=S7QC38_GLOTA|nr:kinase-like protein [Gloeophyllum trabeum ATCC 11539]EPQ56912.1 kinase-like protein [Gloeophyllum trabeum ATCC 11539]
MASTKHIKRVTLTSKKNWWMVELDDEEQNPSGSSNSFSSSEETAVAHDHLHHLHHGHRQDSHYSTHQQAYADEHPDPQAVQVFNPPRHPTAIFNFPTPSSYSAPSNPLVGLMPFANGSASELFKCVVKKPDVVQLEINGEMQSNASDVTTQFLAELRVYTTVTRHRNIAAFLGCLENVGMVLEYIDGRTLYDVVRAQPELTAEKKIDYHDQLLDGLCHLHSFGLSHGDLSLLNIEVTYSSDTIKLLDFGRSVSCESEYVSPDEPLDPFAFLARTPSNNHSYVLPKLTRKVEQIHPGTRPFAAPEILRGECQDARLADAYSFGMVLVCLDRCALVDVKPWEQRKDQLPKGFLDGLELFGARATEYLKRFDRRRRLLKEDLLKKERVG